MKIVTPTYFNTFGRTIFGVKINFLNFVTSGMDMRSLLSKYPLLPLSRCWNLLYNFRKFDFDRSVSTFSCPSSAGDSPPDFELKTSPIFTKVRFNFEDDISSEFSLVVTLIMILFFIFDTLTMCFWSYSLLQESQVILN